MDVAKGYSKIQIRLHWAIAALVLLQFLFHDGMAQAWDTAVRNGVFDLSGSVILHFVLGGMILGGMMWRFALRQERGVPAPLPQEPAPLRTLSRVAHLGFYAVLILLPVTGGLAWGMRSPVLSGIHEVLRLVLVALILAHVAAVIYHQRVLRSGLLRRMTRAAGSD